MAERYPDTRFRLRNWDYRNPAYYFVTICTAGKSKWLGSVRPSGVELSPIGIAAVDCWYAIPQHFPFVSIDEFAIMPDHVHGIVIINQVNGGQPVGDKKFFVPYRLPGKNTFGPQSKNLGSIIRGYKIGVKQFANRNNLHFTWQDRYRDSVVWDSDAYGRIAQYIRNHPRPLNYQHNFSNEYRAT